jgi:ribosomal protein S18 acetylase RimI-like enzyme
MDLFKISALTDPNSNEVVELLARAYLTNPINAAALGGSGEKELKLNHELFRVSCELVFRGEWYTVRDGSRTVGVLHMVNFPHCRLSHEQREAIGPRLSESIAKAASRVTEWLGEWAKRDPDTDHCHLGPIAVLPEYQRRGIGKLMMQNFCERVDEAGTLSYLETDRSENVGFYEKSGFTVTEQATILGVTNWFMSRTSRGAL